MMSLMAFETIDPVPVTFDPDVIGHRIRFEPVREGLGSFAEFVDLVMGLIRPRAIYASVFTGAKGERTVEVAGVTFQSLLLRKNLDTANKVFPYILTVGPDLERFAGAQGDLLTQYYLEEMANVALESAAGWLSHRLESRFGLTGLANISPGSLEDWPLTEQTKLFSIFGDTERHIGVRLTDSLLMVPRKSISGILFPSEEGFASCRLCDHEHCPSRKAAYAGPFDKAVP